METRRVVVVTGASAGIGRATARAFAARGDAVALLARESDRLECATKEVLAMGADAVACPVDVADADAVDAAADVVVSELGIPDVWVNCAMTSVFAPFSEITADEYRRVTDVTYHGYVNGTRAALRVMRPADRGTIVQVGSALAYRGIPLQTAYCGAKHAIQGFTDALRSELLHEGSGVTLTSVHLPAVNTPQFDWVLSRLPNDAQPVPPIFQPELAAEAVLHAAGHRRREYWLAWPTIRTIVAQRFMPDVLDRVLGRTGYSAQQTGSPRPPDRPSNLWEPVEGDWATRGRFDDRARSASRTFEVARFRDGALRATRLDAVLTALTDAAARALARFGG